MKKILKIVFFVFVAIWLIFEAVNYFEYLSKKHNIFNSQLSQYSSVTVYYFYQPILFKLAYRVLPFLSPQTTVDKKPVIYLYPTTKQQVQVQLDFKGKIIADYPSYDIKKKGWTVTAYPDGKIFTSDGKEYSYLFWEGVPYKNPNYDLSSGFIVRGEDTIEFLQNTLSKMGLTPKEYNEFIVYWFPIMKNNKYNLIHFAESEYENTALLNIIPKPDSMLRIFMVFKSIDNTADIKPQEIKPFVRNGFTVIEWGGAELNK